MCMNPTNKINGDQTGNLRSDKHPILSTAPLWEPKSHQDMKERTRHLDGKCNHSDWSATKRIHLTSSLTIQLEKNLCNHWQETQNQLLPAIYRNPISRVADHFLPTNYFPLAQKRPSNLVINQLILPDEIHPLQTEISVAPVKLN
jgi:hypothetical protein